MPRPALRTSFLWLVLAALVGSPVAVPAQAAAPAPKVYVDLTATPLRGDLVRLRGTVIGSDEAEIETSTCARGCPWESAILGSVDESNDFYLQEHAGPEVVWYRVRAGRKSSWPVSVVEVDGRAEVAEYVAPKPFALADGPTVTQASGIIGWVQVRRCRTTGRRLVASGMVRNRSAHTKDLLIRASWTDEESDVLATDLAVLLDVPSGATRRWQVESVARAGDVVTACVPNAVAARVRG